MDKQTLKSRLLIEKRLYPCFQSKGRTLYAFLCHDRDYYTYRYVKYLRKTEYYMEKKQTLAGRLLYIFYKHKKNKLGSRIGLDFGENTFDTGLFIAHTDIIVGSAKVGKNCKLHGQNCIGSGAVLGDDCELWVGAKVFGPAHLANGITVAAGAVVISSFEEEGITIGGVPARKLK